MSRIGFITYQNLPDLTPVDATVLKILAEQGHETQALIWNDRAVDWQSFDSLVLRSTWDYHTQPAVFQTWLKKLVEMGVPLWNPASLVRWNMSKYYLRELSQKGIAIPETVWLRKNETGSLQDLMPKAWERAVLKPVVSASAENTYLLDRNKILEFQPKFEDLLSEEDYMLQPFMPQIQTEGEWSLIFFDKVFSHAVVKKPKKGDFKVQTGQHYAAEPSDAFVAQAQTILEEINAPVLYTRVDGLNVNGEFMLMELELIEPYLFLEDGAGAMERFAEVIEGFI